MGHLVDRIREYMLSLISDRMLKPWRSTGGMAEDAIVLLDYLGWKGDREVHVVGVSLGGMIAQGMLAGPFS